MDNSLFVIELHWNHVFQENAKSLKSQKRHTAPGNAMLDSTFLLSCISMSKDIAKHWKTSEHIGRYPSGLLPPKKKHVTRASPTLENHHDPLDVRRLVCDSCNLKATTGLFIEKVF